jgi:Gas vesicle synthesis protein GvpL/GvpF
MPASTVQDHGPARQGGRTAACYVYGVMPAGDAGNQGDAGNPPALDTPGVGDPPAQVTVVRHGDIAALVSEVDLSQPLGRPEDLLAHQRVLDGASEAMSVLPMRFGAVVSDTEAVADELLGPHHDEFAATLDEIDGRAQYVISGRYDEQAVLAEVVAEEPEAARLRQEIRGQDEDVTRPARIRLGEIISQAIAARRDADNAEAARVFEPLCAASVVRQPTHEFASAHLALLADKERQAELEQASGELARAWEGRAGLRLLGPMAPYDFVVSPEMEG